mmetsp:Transcript_40411/g.73208  ORF Transcript_40411/g.73208 Transcript_40411/m.73208 type:complete len:419 (+) Transcript_40411:62-1318(+)
MKEPSVKHIALLIDVENMRTANPKECLQAMLTELLRNGELVVKRAYGDFSNDATVQSWESVLRAERVRRVAPSGEKGKKACDMLLLIEAMDLLHQNPVIDCFVLATADGDFAPLADRLREAGKQVVGLGFHSRASKAFVKSCHTFLAVENLMRDAKAARLQPKCGGESQATREVQSAGEGGPPADAGKRIVQAVTSLAANKPSSDGWVRDSELFHFLRRKDPAFDVRTWGYTNVRDFLEHVDALEVHVEAGFKGSSNMWVRKNPTAEALSDKVSAPKSKQSRKRPPPEALCMTKLSKSSKRRMTRAKREACSDKDGVPKTKQPRPRTLFDKDSAPKSKKKKKTPKTGSDTGSAPKSMKSKKRAAPETWSFFPRQNKIARKTPKTELLDYEMELHRHLNKVAGKTPKDGAPKPPWHRAS